jgi:thiamine biosynthesis protein ThiI
MPETYVVHYSEIALKGKNRPLFTRFLKRNILRALRPLGEVDIQYVNGRFIVSTDANEGAVTFRLSGVFGVSWFAHTKVVKEDFASIKEAILNASEHLGPAKSFRIEARRADKSFPMNSLTIAGELGEAVALKTGATVNLDEPDTTLHADILEGRALVYSEKQPGPGGLPVGVGGRVIHLFSGGIDSPVAAWALMKRGCMPVHLHFYLAPSPEYVLESKILKIVQVLSRYAGRTTMVLVPFAEYQVAASSAPADAEPSLFRRFMRLTAEALAPSFGAHGISTGDSLAQAASQTLWNLGVFDEGSSLPILRPLLTYDKQEITELAKSIGTYELSIQDYKDCCAIITRHPKTRAKRESIAQYAAELDFPSLVKKCLSLATLVTYIPAKGETRSVPLDLTRPRPGPPSETGQAPAFSLQ